jgi:hypothetical protein
MLFKHEKYSAKACENCTFNAFSRIFPNEFQASQLDVSSQTGLRAHCPEPGIILVRREQHPRLPDALHYVGAERNGDNPRRRTIFEMKIAIRKGVIDSGSGQRSRETPGTVITFSQSQRRIGGSVVVNTVYGRHVQHPCLNVVEVGDVSKRRASGMTHEVSRQAADRAVESDAYAMPAEFVSAPTGREQ